MYLNGILFFTAVIITLIVVDMISSKMDLPERMMAPDEFDMDTRCIKDDESNIIGEQREKTIA